VYSVVLATHNRSRRLAALLASLREQTVGTGTFQVIVVDDGSGDDTPAVLAAEAAHGVLDLVVLRNETASGPAVARDAGWRAGKGELVAFTDDDCVLSPGWLGALAEAWNGRPDVLVQGRTDPISDELEAEGPFSRTLRVRSLGPNYQTCNVAYPRHLLERVDGFDTETFTVPGGEDADLAWRCFAAGAEAVFAPDAQAHHAVHQLGPVGKLRVAWRWHETMRLYKRHPGLRAHLTYRVFWKKSHYLLLRAAIGLALPRRWWLRPLRFWCLAPLAPSYLERARHEGGNVLAAPYFLVHDVVELAAAIRGAVRYRTLVL